jgi:hypothetical protein
VNIAEDIGSAYQLRRYAWSAKLPLSILTDFEEFAVYDCRIKPDKSDKASTARIMYLTERDYPARWEEIAAIFSKDAVLKGSFDKYADTAKLKKGTAGVDAAFLKEIETWREILARNIALRNPRLSQRELNAAVTLTINRIIFLRICEDRGVETYGQLMALKNGSDIYERLIRIYYAADDKYNSGLFHFRAERDRTASPDKTSLAACTIRTAPMNSPSCPPIFWGRSMSSFWGRSFISQRDTGRRWKTSRRSKRRAASITRRHTLSITL